jgi:hypothetical protein
MKFNAVEFNLPSAQKKATVMNEKDDKSDV